MNKNMNASKGKSGWIVAGLLLCILMASMDNTIMATSMGMIVGELGGLDKFVWVISAYMVAEMAGMPIFGKLSDMYGRKRFFMFGIVVFMIGSALCGTASSIVELSIYRAIQGIGAGALIPVCFTIMYDAISPKDRGKMMGLFGAVYGMSSVFGPLLGAFFTDYVSWQWIFYINLPLGLLALLLVGRHYRDSLQVRKNRIDWLGAATLVGAITCLLFAFELGGNHYAWDSTPIVGMFIGSLLLILAFIAAERKAAEPIIPFHMFRDRMFASSILIAVFSGAAFICASVYLPIFMQGVLGGTATHSGLVLLPMMLGTVVSATTSGFVMNRFTYRSILLATLTLLVAGLLLLATITADTSKLLITLYMILVGLGIGASFSILVNAAIHHVPANQRGSANATLNFLRAFGMTVGVTIYGILQSKRMLSEISANFSTSGMRMPEGIDFRDPYVLMSPSTRSLIPEQTLELIIQGLANSLTSNFAWGLIPAVLALGAAFLMSKAKHDPTAEQELQPSAH